MATRADPDGGLPAYAQQETAQDPAKVVAPATSPRDSVWLPKGASSEPDLSDGIGVSAIDQHPDPGVQQWQVRRADVSVRRMLQRWAQEAGWQLLWDAPRDFPIETELQLSGRIEQVVSAVVESLATTDYPVQARINSELRIIRIGRYLEGKAR
ncbi:toxin co-regulated pilus biosynthesis Q family protein [Herbaspirillum frisingense]|uniref:toxin co-regulated pilus biosynthesis Q family protein n=1 Tax=Herbaspirillum frisingense TaxID=92645 RepID=UPI001F31C996|nr:toxin co-regulated pilus biosynthesis Q family protein [Herbaspirillum frisingense]UIN19844.1 toxin co-regulated pilus biosynthesis Q family protein [Herbaspirillum frisingense]